MKSKIKNISAGLLVILIMLLQSCESDYLVRNPLSGPSDETYFVNQEELMLAVNGLYSAMRYSPIEFMPSNLTIDAASDIGWDRNNSALQSVGRGNHDSNNSYTLEIWTKAYQVIGKCNFVLDNIDKLTDKMDINLLARLKAETRFIRAFTYQYMIDYFGAVPLVTSGLSLSEAQIPRTPKEEIVDFILNELDEVAIVLPKSFTGSDVGRATKGAALAIRARTALHNERWDEAAKSAKAVMDLDVYSLHPDFGELFSYNGENSKEIIFAFQYLKLQSTSTHNTPRALLSRNAKGHTNKIPTQSLVDSYTCIDGLEIDKSPLFDPAKPFENRDPRLGFTVALPGSIFFNYQFETHKDSVLCWNYNVTPATRITNQEATNAYATFSGYCWKKYVDIKDKADVANSELNVIQSRYAEVLLIYAEAMIEANKIDQSVYQAINEVRERPSVNMPPIAMGKSQVELRELVRKERLYELAMEGFRMVDLRRWKLAEKMIKGPVYGRIPTGLLASAPTIDKDGKVNYDHVPNQSEMRVIEMRDFNPNRDYLWPIPNIELVTNPALTPNENY